MKALFLSDKSFQHRLFGAQSCPALKGGPLYRAIGSLENLCFQLERMFAAQDDPGHAQGISTITEPFCSLTLYVVTFKVGITVNEPVRTSNFQPCQGQVIVEPLRLPSPRGPPRCRQTFAKAKYSSLTRNSAMLLPSTFTTLPDPSVRSLFSAILTNFAKLWLAPVFSRFGVSR